MKTKTFLKFSLNWTGFEISNPNHTCSATLKANPHLPFACVARACPVWMRPESNALHNRQPKPPHNLRTNNQILSVLQKKKNCTILRNQLEKRIWMELGTLHRAEMEWACCVATNIEILREYKQTTRSWEFRHAARNKRRLTAKS